MKKILFVCLIVFSACGPSKEEIEQQLKEHPEKELRTTTIVTDNCGCSNVTLTYYNIDSCDYVGKLRNTSSDFVAHAGQCRFCQKRQAHLIDSLIKKNLEEFFKLSKNRIP
jgi:hypothetical protein